MTRQWHDAALPWCLAAEESYWEIFLSLERNMSPKESRNFLGDAVVRLELLVLEED